MPLLNLLQTSDHGRRTFLKQTALGSGGTLLAPLLNRLALAGEGRSPASPRFLFVVEGNGLPPEQVHPVGIPFAKRTDRQSSSVQSLSGLKLPVSLQPVSTYQDRLTIIQGLSGRMCTGGHSSDHGALGAYHANNGRNVQGPTIDALLGQAFPGILTNLVLGIASNANESVIFNCSASRRGRSLPTICKPDIAFSQIFGSVTEGQARATFAAKRNLMDFIKEDVKRVRSQLGGVEREKLDAYLNAYEAISGTSERLVDARETLADVAPVADGKYQSEVETDRLDAHFELATAALIGGVTNVATIASGVGFPYFNIAFTGLGIGRGKHPIGHDYRSEMNGQGWTEAEQIRSYHFELIARSMRKLDSIPEGNGTMLDNTVIVYLSDAAEEHHSTCFEWPIVILGNLNGARVANDRYIMLPDYGRPGHRTINTLYNSLCHAAGVPRDDFGHLDPLLDAEMCRGRLAELF